MRRVGKTPPLGGALGRLGGGVGEGEVPDGWRRGERGARWPREGEGWRERKAERCDDASRKVERRDVWRKRCKWGRVAIEGGWWVFGGGSELCYHRCLYKKKIK